MLCAGLKMSSIVRKCFIHMDAVMKGRVLMESVLFSSAGTCVTGESPSPHFAIFVSFETAPSNDPTAV